MKKFTFLLIFFAFVQFNFAQVADEKTQKILELLELTGATELGIQAMHQMIEVNKSNPNPDIPAEFWDIFVNEINIEELRAITIPIYAKYFSLQEINELIAFYQTPIGKKAKDVLPQIQAEAMQAGQVWGAQVAERALMKLQEKENK